MVAENWKAKREKRLAAWKSTEDMEFVSPEAEEKYEKRANMLIDTLNLEKPDRVLVFPNVGFFPAEYAGITAEEAMYNYDKLGMAWKKYHDDFNPDFLASSMIVTPGKVFEILDYQIYDWPGHGTPADTPYQCLEGEYMKAEEYDLLINDPSNYWMRFYLPRVFGVLESWVKLAPLTDIVEMPFVGNFMIPFGMPDVQESLEKMKEAGEAALEWIQAAGAIDGQNVAKHGVLTPLGAFSKAPFDTLADTMRGTRQMMLDLYRRPEKVKAALETLVPAMIDLGVRGAQQSGVPLIFIPLHKGADTFMSRDTFCEFYWPTLKAVMQGIIEEGFVPVPFVEGSYNERLDLISDPELPSGSVMWIFDKTDMNKVKEHLGGHHCFMGNVPVSMLKAGTPDEVRTYSRQLIEEVGDEGGFILASGGVVDHAEPENLKAMIDAALQYDY